MTYIQMNDNTVWNLPDLKWNPSSRNEIVTFHHEHDPPLPFKIFLVVFPCFVIFVIIMMCYRCCCRNRILRNRNRNNPNRYWDDTQDITNTWISNDSCQYPYNIPNKAVKAGKDLDDSDVYVGRALKHGDWLVAKIIPSKHKAYVSWGSNEIQITDYEYLCGENYDWIYSTDNNNTLPTNAVSPGSTQNGEQLYIGRGRWRGCIVPGKIHPSHNCLYIPFDGREIALSSYEILVKPEHNISDIGFGHITNTINHPTAAPVVVTSQSHTTTTGYPISIESTPSGGYQATPYPNTAYPMPQPGATSQPPYPVAAPYPTGMPMPQSTGYPHPQPNTGYQPSNMPPYPLSGIGASNSDPNSNPPSYDQVVGSESYNKQAAYNPHYPVN